jgi:hypothetical protein
MERICAGEDSDLSAKIKQHGNGPRESQVIKKGVKMKPRWTRMDVVKFPRGTDKWPNGGISAGNVGRRRPRKGEASAMSSSPEFQLNSDSV